MAGAWLVLILTLVLIPTFLTAEGWSYFALALLELLSHNIPAVRDSVSVFSIVDIVLGAFNNTVHYISA
jgi:hypothetical protein